VCVHAVKVQWGPFQITVGFHLRLGMGGTKLALGDDWGMDSFYRVGLIVSNQDSTVTRISKSEIGRKSGRVKYSRK